MRLTAADENPSGLRGGGRSWKSDARRAMPRRSLKRIRIASFLPQAAASKEMALPALKVPARQVQFFVCNTVRSCRRRVLRRAGRGRRALLGAAFRFVFIVKFIIAWHLTPPKTFFENWQVNFFKKRAHSKKVFPDIFNGAGMDWDAAKETKKSGAFPHRSRRTLLLRAKFHFPKPLSVSLSMPDPF